MALPLIPLIAVVALCGLAIYQFIMHPIFLSPLSKIPNAHWSAPISRLWILHKRSGENETPVVHAAHQKLGPIIRLAPNEISVNSVEGGIRTIYSGGYEKGDWYLNVFSNYGIKPMFAMPDHSPHSKRKRMLSNIYAKSTLQASAPMSATTDILVNDCLTPRLKQAADGGKPVEFYDIFCAAAMDFVSAYVFGLKNSALYMKEPDLGKRFFRDYKARQQFQFWPQDVPSFTRFVKRIGLGEYVYPEWASKANKDIENWILSMCDKAEATIREREAGNEGKVQDWPTVYSQLRTALLKDVEKNADTEKGSISIDEQVKDLRLTIASEMLDHTLAGFDTSSITLTFLAWELSRPEHAKWQERLYAELSGFRSSDHVDNKELDNLPILHAILMETLRLHAAIPGNQPRITPSAATLGAPGHTITNLPPNVRVQAQAWSLHRNPEVFPDPEGWNPARWLESSETEMREMNRWFWAFGSGGRMCVGSNLAMLDMKAIMAGIWGRFGTSVVEGRGMVHNGGYVAEPVGWEGKFCVLKVDELGE